MNLEKPKSQVIQSRTELLSQNSDEKSSDFVEKRSWNKERPISAKQSDKLSRQIKNRKVGRPMTAAKAPPQRQRNQDQTFLQRIKPRNVSMDKERLYEEFLQLKLKFNATQDENMKLKTKVNQLEREMVKFEEALQSKPYAGGLQKSHLIQNLKNKLKEQQTDNVKLQEMINKYKRNLRVTKVGELETEVQSYIDECTRLRFRLEEVMQADNNSKMNTQNEEKAYQQLVQYSNVKRENQELTASLAHAKDEIVRWRDKASEAEKKVRVKQKANESAITYKNELIKLKKRIKDMQKEIDQKEEAHKREIRRLKDAYKENISTHRDKGLINSIRHKEKQLKITKDQDNSVNISDIPDNLPVISTQISSTKNLSQEIPQKQQNDSQVPSRSKNQHPPKLFRRIYRYIRKKQMLFFTFLSLFDKQNQNFLSTDELYKQLWQVNIKISRNTYQKELQEVLGIQNGRVILSQLDTKYEEFEYSNVNSDSDISIDEIDIVQQPLENELKVQDDQVPVINIIETTESSAEEISLEQVSDILCHIALRMQLHRISRKDLNKALFRQEGSKKEIQIDRLKQILSEVPFNLEQDPNLIKLCRFLIGGNGQQASHKYITDQLNQYLPYWEVYTPELEEKYDKELNNFFSGHKITLKVALQAVDEDNTNQVSFQDFKNAINEINLKISEGALDYIKVLSYSHQFLIDKIPYKHLIKAYSNPSRVSQEVEDSQIFEQKDEMVIYDIFGQIAGILLKFNLTVRDVFQGEGSDYIAAEQFQQSLDKLNISFEKYYEDRPNLLQLMVNSLQTDEDNQQRGIRIQNLEQLLLNYGVPIKLNAPNTTKFRSISASRNTTSRDKLSIKSVTHEQRTSSPEEMYEYSEDSYGESNESPFGLETDRHLESNEVAFHLPDVSEIQHRSIQELVENNQETSSEEDYDEESLGESSMKILQTIEKQKKSVMEEDYEDEFIEESQEKPETEEDSSYSEYESYESDCESDCESAYDSDYD